LATGEKATTIPKGTGSSTTPGYAVQGCHPTINKLMGISSSAGEEGWLN